MNYCYPERFHWSHTAVVAIGLLKLYCLTAPRNFIIHTVAPGWMGPETNHHRCNVDRNLSLKTRLCWKKDYQQIRPLIIKVHTSFILLTFQLQRLHRLNGWGPPSFTCNPHLAITIKGKRGKQHLSSLNRPLFWLCSGSALLKIPSWNGASTCDLRWREHKRLLLFVSVQRLSLRISYSTANVLCCSDSPRQLFWYKNAP